MSLETIRAILCGGLLIIGGIIGFIGGVPGWALAIVLITGVPSLFAWGCHKAARQARHRALALSEDTLDMIITESGVRPNTPRPYRGSQDRRVRRHVDAQ